MDNPISVKRFLEQVKVLVEPRFSNVCLTGEVSNFRSSGRHWYFTLKEEGAALSCAIWATTQQKLRHVPNHGERVIVAGYLSVYVQGGALTLVVNQCELSGAGDLQQKLRDLEAALRREGVFDKAKRPLPRFPQKIAVIAALGGAALQDILEVTKKRAPGIDIMVFPAMAQGERCVMENLMALQEAQDEYWGCDVIIMARGGGSIEDLWGFNDPELVRAVSNCRIPIITGVGHEIDLTLVDLASDKRAATPSQAAELATPDRNMLLAKVARKLGMLDRHMDWHLQGDETSLNLLTDQGLARLDPTAPHQALLDRLALQLERAAPFRKMDLAASRLALIAQRLNSAAANKSIAKGSAMQREYARRLDAAMTKTIEIGARRLAAACGQLKGLHPESPLDRGFVLATDSENRQIKSSAQLKDGSNLHLRWKDGGKWAVIASSK
jgi:exodeoxyribonuclease VII large subunit